MGNITYKEGVEMDEMTIGFRGGKIANTNITDKQTIVLQFYEQDRAAVTRIVKKYAPCISAAHVTINGWIKMDVYVDLEYNPWNRPTKTWVRIAYEVLDNNPAPTPLNGKFTGAPIIRFERGISEGDIEFDIRLLMG